MSLRVWLRWSLFLPASVIALTVVYAVVSFLNMLSVSFVGPKTQLFMSLVLASGASAYSFVWVGAKVAPSRRPTVAIVLAVLYGFLAAFVLSAKALVHLYSVSWLEALCVTIPGIIGAVLASVSLRADSSCDG